MSGVMVGPRRQIRGADIIATWRPGGAQHWRPLKAAAGAREAAPRPAGGEQTNAGRPPERTWRAGERSEPRVYCPSRAKVPRTSLLPGAASQ